MKVTIKAKLRFGLLFLFAVILTIGVLGGLFLYRLSDESGDIIKDNYESVVYTKSMLEACDVLAASPGGEAERRAKEKFSASLRSQMNNITENGEDNLTSQLGAAYSAFEKDTGRAKLNDLFTLRGILYSIQDLNLHAITQKNLRTNETSHTVILWMTIIGTIAVLVSFSFVVNFPGFIANPVRELTSGIKEIAARNYSKRLHFSSNDEFGELAAAFNSMTEKLEEYESSNLAKLLFEKKRLDTVISSMHDAIIGLDENGNILFLNPVAAQLLGVKSENVTGKQASSVAATNDLLRELTRNIGKESNEKDLSPLKIFADGRESFFNREVLRVTAVPTGESAPQVIGYVIVLKNITQFRELDLAKTNFIATVSHELKTPISSIKMSLNLLEDQRVGMLNEEQKKLIGYIRDESNRLLRLTGELLDISQVETGKIVLDIRSARPAEIIGYAVKAIEPQARQKNVTIKSVLPESVPDVLADTEKAAWVLINLLSNAIRYAPENSSVEINATRNDGTVRFSVRDQGRGIPEEYRERIFEKFFRAPGIKTEGTGLGLAIAKEFILSQKGNIGFDSFPGKGTEFWFTLPTQ
ncbi:MAG TPA: ATP-binding protein [Bacteroidia bacterium]|nr:ATP-binding protein [Bacteroidia bacterium]